MQTDGIVKFCGILNEDELAVLRTDSDSVYAKRRAVQERNGVAAGMEGTAHHVLGEGNSLDRFIADLPLQDFIAEHFGGKFILLNFGATLHPPGGGAYTLRPHRDVRAWTRNYPLSLNMLVMLDDFTLQNGATLFLKASHRTEEMPSRAYFEENAQPSVGRAGDIVLFDSLVVHAAAPNRSALMRRALTLCFGRPFIKPQMDWPRFMAPDAEATLSPCARQLLGYDARIPASVDEYYQPPERWAFKPDQR